MPAASRPARGAGTGIVGKQPGKFALSSATKLASSVGRQSPKPCPSPQPSSSERGALPRVFDALGDDGEVEALRDPQHGLGEDAVAVRVERRDERPVDLQPVDGEALAGS